MKHLKLFLLLFTLLSMLGVTPSWAQSTEQKEQWRKEISGLENQVHELQGDIASLVQKLESKPSLEEKYPQETVDLKANLREANHQLENTANQISHLSKRLDNDITEAMDKDIADCEKQLQYTRYRIVEINVRLEALVTQAQQPTGNIITMTTAKQVGETIILRIEANGSYTVEGAENPIDGGYNQIYTLTSQTVTIKGDVTIFSCEDDEVETLDISNNTVLTNLNCYANRLQMLDVSKNTSLTKLYCSYNSLHTLDVSNNTTLEILGCSYNKLHTLDLSNNTALLMLSCSNNQLQTLDVSNNTALTSLDCSNNQLQTLDVSKNTELRDLYCINNQIRGEAMGNLIASLTDYPTEEWGEGVLWIIDNIRGTEGNICTKTQVAAAIDRGWQPRKYTNSGWTNYEGLGDGIITMTTAKQVGETISLYIDANGDYTVEGAEKPIDGEYGYKTYTLTSQTVTIKGDVTALICNDNQLQTLDVTNNTALTELYCDGNQLQTLDVSKNTALTRLSCSTNQLLTLDVSKNIALSNLSCIANQLQVLNMSKNTAVTELVCSENQLQTLDVSKNTALKYLYCDGNQLQTLDVSENTELRRLNCRNNQLQTIDVSKNTVLTLLLCSTNQLLTLDVSKNTALTLLSCSTNQLLTLDVSKNMALSTLHCDGNQLQMVDVSKNTELSRLDCSNNQLQTLDVSKNTALQDLYCDGNQLQTLDVSKNVALRVLGCAGNQIKGVEMDNLIASLTNRVAEEQMGVFLVFDGNSNLKPNTCTKIQVAAAIDRGWQPMQRMDYSWENYEGSDGALTLANTTVTNENQDDILEDGKASYNEGNKTLTLSNINIANANDLPAIASEVDGLTINVVGNCTLTGKQAVMVLSGNTVITGGGKLTIESDAQNGIDLKGGTLTIRDCTVEVKGEYGIGAAHVVIETPVEVVETPVEVVEVPVEVVSPAKRMRRAPGEGYGSVVIDRATVHITSNTAAIFNIASLTLNECSIVSPAGAAFDAQLLGVALNGKLVTGELSIVPVTTDISTLPAGEEIQVVYDMQGRLQNGLKKGVNIVRTANGKMRKVVRK